jgi:poly(ribitol-phosphate) beta-N-acetylglucosaminyltransferase
VTERDDALKVSVVIPAYNPGSYLSDCIASLTRQSLPGTEYEVIFVDDGSTDGTAELLDEATASEPNFTVIHLPNRGSPGGPRNVGMDAARGGYLYFVDADDWIGDETLERLYARAERNQADVVVGKEVGHGKGVPRNLFRRNVDDAKLLETPLLTLLTPHKFFRRALIRDHDIRFPEDWKRLEDHAFVLAAFFKASRISVLADYPCYHWMERSDAGNISGQFVEPSAYYRYLREVLDIVDAHVDDRATRDRFYAHWYRGKALHRMRGAAWADDPDARALSVYEEVRKLSLERFGPGVTGALPMKFRVLSRSVREGRLDLIQAQAGLERRLAATPSLTEVSSADGKLRLVLSATLTYTDGSPVRLRRAGDGWRWAPPPPLAGDPAILDEDLDVTDEVGRTVVAVILRNRDTLVEYDAVTTVEDVLGDAESTATISPRVSAEIDPTMFAAGRPLEHGTWDFYVHVASCGWGSIHRLPSDPDALGDVGPLTTPDTDLVAVPYVTGPGNLSLRVSVRAGPPPSPAFRERFEASIRALADPSWAAGPNGKARDLFADARLAALDYAGDVSALPMRLRVLARAVRTDRIDLVRQLARLTAGLRLEISPAQAGTRSNGTSLPVAISLRYGNGSPVLLRRDGDRAYWVPPEGVAGTALSDRDLDVTDDLPRTTVRIGAGRGADGRETEIAVRDSGPGGALTLEVLRVPSDGAPGRKVVVETCGWRVEGRLLGHDKAAPSAARDGRGAFVLERGLTRARRIARRAVRSLNLR